MAVVSIPTTCGYRTGNDQWTTADLNYFISLAEARGSELSYQEKEAIYEYRIANATGSGAAIDVIIDSDGVILTSNLIEDKDVALISYGGQSYNSESWRKGDISDTDEEVTASDTITLTNGGSFYAGQRVTIIFKAT